MNLKIKLLVTLAAGILATGAWAVRGPANIIQI